MSALILALNPSIDAEWRVDDVLWEEKNNVQSERRWAGGKGINVARWLKHLGGKPRLLVPLGGSTGEELAGYLRGEKIPATAIQLREPTRVNVIVTTRRGRQMRFNPMGPQLARVEWRAVLKRVEQELVRPAGLLVLSGSLPRGVAVSTYQKLIRLAHQHGVKTLLDCDGAPFAAAVKARPFLVKPNEHELAQWRGKPLRTERELLRAARKLSVTTEGWVLISRGGKRSWLVNVSEGVEIHAMPPRVKPRNTVGAGDALLAAVALEIQRGKPPTDWLRCGLETGTAATQLQAGKLPKS
ncbi:MAG: 1-phosphofructokinase family hexose kinase [Verrucomicrobiales bacterium]|nr:MAG: 1-phosphofructokinase family hexose kinase [Verrucomicrobiales bacterium]